MGHRFRTSCIVGCFAGLSILGAPQARAGAHTWDVQEIFSNAAGTIQFVELFEANGTANEVNVPGQVVKSNSKTYVIPAPALTPPRRTSGYSSRRRRSRPCPGRRRRTTSSRRGRRRSFRQAAIRSLTGRRTMPRPSARANFRPTESIPSTRAERPDPPRRKTTPERPSPPPASPACWRPRSRGSPTDPGSRSPGTPVPAWEPTSTTSCTASVRSFRRRSAGPTGCRRPGSGSAPSLLRRRSGAGSPIPRSTQPTSCGSSCWRTTGRPPKARGATTAAGASGRVRRPGAGPASAR